MKFFVSRQLQENWFLVRLMDSYILGVLLYLVLALFLENLQYGLFPHAIRSHVMGSTDLGFSAIPLENLIYSIHIKLFVGMVSLLVLGSTIYRFGLVHFQSHWILVTGFLTCLGDALSLLLIPFSPAVFSNTKSVCFFFMEAAMLLLCVRCVFELHRLRKKATP